MGSAGDPTRIHVMDAPMMAAMPSKGSMLDIGCGEGRFCRMMQARGMQTVGLDPTSALLAQARARDPEGAYVQGRAEELPFADRRFDAAVFYLSLIDIKGFRRAIAQAARVLKRGGILAVANLHAYVTARPADFSAHDSAWLARDGKPAVTAIDEMMQERSYVTAWSGVRITNYHRPLSAYMTAFLDAGLTLTTFTDPPYTGGDRTLAARFGQMPWAFQMVWQKMEIQDDN